ncbi:C45 family autoproteolytic acyltransferase/hydolase [Tautonia plasticadhaerens]|uniref:Acyl-coenzyme A:6-aminopenicillanic acid acyl-transferase n=1 Tax=Tautonia plasticadhaerens TaxID=2527974 RepID=A0A518H6Y3_9BACT|nr:C45 family peptidase [Tautonia plasticadhaerens]QDV36627.1 Acyl-coenzyme A:6-aminopenicillanic acid acyl-transferase [Tautonia plasticadhaerens]
MPRFAPACLAATIVLLAAPMAVGGEPRTVSRCGDGFLEEIDGRRVLHVSGSPYEMGYQHGRLLRDEIGTLTRFLLDEKAGDLEIELGGLTVDPKAVIRSVAEGQRQFVPDRYFEELQGVADGSGVPLEDLVVCNFIPELFHCSGFALSGSATKDGALLHGRVLDYGTDWRLQEFAVLIVAEPEGLVPFVNVSYAGFIGSVTGMNAERISVGEMGGRGLGHWAGVPMAVLVRRALEEATSLDEAVAVFRDSPRTCEYYYVIADGEENRAVGMEASWHAFSTVAMGEAHPKLPRAVPDAVILSAGDRYEELVRRVRGGLGGFDPESALRLMDRPVAMDSNLHNALFEPGSTRFWVAHASPDGGPAASQPYHEYRLTALLGRAPDASAPEYEAPPTLASAGDGREAGGAR